LAKKKVEYLCEKCGAKFPKWTGRCGHCSAWESLKELTSVASSRSTWVDSGNKPIPLNDIHVDSEAERWKTGVFEFDRVIGGGIVQGSFGLLGGTPGVGKSTLILQLLARIARLNKKALYVTGEESGHQIKQRSNRLLIRQEDILIMVESEVEQILNAMKEHKPDFIVIDSIQTLFTNQFTASAGSVTQVRESANLLMKYAKRNDVSVLLIGHVTKEGDIAGPRTLEHMVDYVLYLEGEKREQHRLLRAVKNRFGTISEVGLFKMTAKGLVEVSKPNNLFVDKFNNPHPGMAIFAANEGTRTLFLEIQVLVGDTEQKNPARTCIGMDRNRLQVIVAVLEKHLQMDFSSNDIYVNLAEGFRVIEPAMDLPVTAALLSSYLLKPLPPKSIFIGEVALTGEFRSVPALQERLYEAARCGFELVFLPELAVKTGKFSQKGVQVVSVKDVQELMSLLS